MSDPFSSALAAVESAVEKRSGAQTLDALLAAWRLRRVPALTDAIEALSKRYEKVIPPIAGKTERACYEQFLDLVAKKRSVDVARILGELPSATVIRARDHAERLGAMDPDPRVARALLDHVAKQRYNLHNTVWTGIFKELRRHGDVRTHEALAKIKPPPGEDSGSESMRKRMQSALAALPASLPASDEETKRIAAITKAIAGLELDEPQAAPKPARATVDEAALFEEMLERPDDDDVRLVLADIYSERGDVRGELIALQVKNACAEKPAAKDVKKEKDLLKQNLMALLGPLEQVVDRKTCVFSRGFLQHAEVKLKTAAQKKELLGHRLLSTLESVVSRDQAVIRSLPNLRVVEGLSWKAFVELAHGAPLPKIRRVAIEVSTADPGQVDLERLDGLPSLEEASFAVFGQSGVYTPENWVWILREAKGLLTKLPRLELATDYWRGRIGPALDELDHHPTVPHLTIAMANNGSSAADITVDITRTETGYHLVTHSPSYDPHFVAMALDSATRTDITLEMRPASKGVKDSAGIDSLRQRFGARFRSD